MLALCLMLLETYYAQNYAESADSFVYATIQRDVKNLQKHCGIEAGQGDFHQIPCTIEHFYGV